MVCVIFFLGGWKITCLTVILIAAILFLCKWILVFLIRSGLLLIDSFEDEDSTNKAFEEYLAIKYGHKKII